MDPAKSEFQCPTCRRLANVLLPDMEASLLTKRPDAHEEGKGIEEAEESWRRFWHLNKNLEHAVEFFCDQVYHHLLGDMHYRGLNNRALLFLLSLNRVRTASVNKSALFVLSLLGRAAERLQL